MNKRALGRGLSTLLPNRPPMVVSFVGEPPPESPTELALDAIVPNPFQPRKHFDEQALAELAASIVADGVIQPLVVRKAGGQYQLIAGERRWRASKLAGLTKVPVHVQEIPDERMLEIALIENIQREDLNAIEESRAYQRLHEDLGLSHEEIGQRTGKDRATISNAIRLLQLPPDIQELVAAKKISSGHARTLLKIADPDRIRELARQTMEGDWSVRRLEQVTSVHKSAQQPEKTSEEADPNVKAAIEELERALGTRVRIKEKNGRGRLEIEFYSEDDLHRIYTAIIPV